MSVTVFAGQLLGSALSATAGPGTHIEGGQIYASRTGKLTKTLPKTEEKSTNSSKASTGDSLSTPNTTYTVTSALPSNPTTTPRSRPLVPTLNSLILGKVIRLNSRQASVSITAIEADDLVTGQRNFLPCMSPFPALLRVQDIRATEKDKVKMLESVRVGDIIKAIVISLGDQASYYLSTARNDLGVVMAWTREETQESAFGEQLLPISWNEMMAANSGRRENRKVAKPL